MARIKTYTTDDKISEYDIVIGSDADNLSGTKNYTMGALQRYALAGLSPLNGGTLSIREFTYSGGLYSTPYAYLNSLDPSITILQYDVVIVNINLVKYLLNKQNITVGIDKTPLVSSDFILIKDAPQTFTQVNADWNATSGVSQIQNKPTIPAAQVQSNWTAVSGVSSILNKPTIPAAQVNSDWSASSGLAQVLNKPTIPAAQVQSDWNATSGVSMIQNKPTINGSETKVTAGTNITVTGSGTIASPYIVNSSVSTGVFTNKGWVEVGDIPRPMSTVLVGHGDITNAIVTGTWGGGNEITITFTNAFPDTNYSVDLQCEYLGTDYVGSSTVYPISWKRVNQNSFKFITAEIGNTQNFNFHFKTISY